MKPNFALGLTDDGITLWQRDATGWLRVGAVAPDATDMDAQMRGLAKIASALAPEGVRTKLVVPDEQILFCDLPVLARNREMQGHEIRAQLAGRTPYPVEELDFDWTVTDGMAKVAVVARETLVEAEDFARDFGLNPISRVAAPVNGSFSQEPFFGPTRAAREIVGDPSLLERDQDILRETGLATLPEPELVRAPEPQPEPKVIHDEAAEQASKSDAKPEPKSATDPKKPEDTAAKSEPKPEPRPAPDPKSEADSEKKTKSRKKKKTSAEDLSAEESTDEDAEDEDPQAPETLAADKIDTKVTEKQPSAPAPVAPPPVEPTPDRPAVTPTPTGSNSADARKSALLAKLRAAKAASETRTTSAEPLAGGMSALDRARQKLTDVLPSRPSTAAGTAEPVRAAETKADDAVAFRSRRAGPATQSAPPAQVEDPKPASDLLGGLRAKFAGAQDLSKRKLGGLTRALGAANADQNPSDAPVTDTAPRPVPAQKPADGKRKSKAAAEAKSPYPIKIGPGAATSGRKDPLETLQARAGSKSSSSASEAERLTIFGARGQTDTTHAVPKPAILILAGLGLILVAAAIWVAYFLSTGPVATDVTEQTDPPADSAPLDTGQVEPETALPESVEEIEAALGLEDAAQQLPLDAPEPAPMADASQQPDVTSGDTAVAESEQPAGRVAGVRTSALLAPQDHLPLPEAPLPPAPFGAEPLPPLRSEVEQEALALAETPDPSENPAPEADPQTGPTLPEGEEALEINVTDGTPSVVPPARPEGLAPEIEVTPEALTLEETPELESATGLTDTAEAAIPSEETTDVQAAPEPAIDPLDESNLEISVTEGRPAVVPPARPAGLAPEPPEAEPVAPDTGSEALAPPSTEDPLPDPSADQAELDAPPPGGVALTALRPAARPAGMADLAEAARAAEAEPVIEGTALAVAASTRPNARPGQFAAVVQRALRAAQQRSTTPTPAAVAAAAPAPAAQAPVQTARAAVPAAPPIPSSASVAREATQARAINLRQINLIGVMGTSSSRRALVRLSNGRVVTVRVGDSLDSGSVTAISENELRYSRRGRDVVLRIAS